LRYPSTDIATILSDTDYFDITRIELESPEEMVADLQQRLADSSRPWNLAIVRAVEAFYNPHHSVGGMVLLRPAINSERFEGLYYKSADCGIFSDNAHATAEMLCLLVYNSIDEQTVNKLYHNFVAVYSKVIVTGLDSDFSDFLPV
jgi:hypothetical protein